MSLQTKFTQNTRIIETESYAAYLAVQRCCRPPCSLHWVALAHPPAPAHTPSGQVVLPLSLPCAPAKPQAACCAMPSCRQRQMWRFARACPLARLRGGCSWTAAPAVRAPARPLRALPVGLLVGLQRSRRILQTVVEQREQHKSAHAAVAHGVTTVKQWVRLCAAGLPAGTYKPEISVQAC